jgi:hypothetical protein
MHGIFPCGITNDRYLFSPLTSHLSPRCRADLENEAGGSSDDDNRTPDPAAMRWGTQTSESMHYLQVRLSLPSPYLACKRLSPECFHAFAEIFADILLQGVNTVGALVIAFSLVFLISSASSQSTRPQQGQQQLQNQRWGSRPVGCHRPSRRYQGHGANLFMFLQAERLHTAKTLPLNTHPWSISFHRILVKAP